MRHQLQFLRVVFVAIALFLGLTGIAVAQEITGSIVGAVKDSNGAGVAGATVTITNSETITVTSELLQVDTQSATASNVINGDQVVQLSLNNRNWAQLILLSPGVS